MSMWSDKLQNSAIHTKARQVLDTVNEDKGAELQPAIMEALDRVSHVMTVLVSTLDDVDPEFVADATITNLNNSLDNLIAYLSNWRQSRDMTYVTTHAQTALDGVLVALGQIPGVNPSVADKVMKSLRDAVAGHRLAVGKATASLNQELANEKEAFQRSAQEAGSVVDKISQRTTAAESRLDKIEDSSQQIIAQQTAAFSKAETDRNETFNLQIVEQKKQLEGAVNELETSGSSMVSKIKAELEEEQKKAAEAQAKIEQILGIVGKTALIGSYSVNARHDGRWSLVWNIMTVLTIGGAIVIAWNLAGEVLKSQPNPYYIGVKALLTLTVGGLAAYTARQASEHRQAQRDAEHMALQLAAIQPYLAGIDDSGKRDDLLSKIALKLFGTRAAGTKGKNKKDATNGDEDALIGRALVEVAREWLKGLGK